MIEKAGNYLPFNFDGFKAQSPNDYIKHCEKWAQKVEKKGNYTVPEPIDYTPPLVFPEVPDSLNSFHPNNSKSLKWDRTYQELKRGIVARSSFVLCGNRGTGKSQMGVCLIKFCCQQSKSAIYTQLLDMHADLKEDIRNKRKYITPYFLAIDQLEIRYNTDAEDRYIDHIINKRHGDKKSTLIITNDKPDSLNEVLGASIVDRIIETGGIIECNWESFRR